MTGVPARYAARPFVALLGLVLVPGLALAYFGLRGVAERENALRTQYVATTTLVRDRLVAALARREDAVREFLESSLIAREAATDPRKAMGWLEALATNHPWLSTPFLISGEALVTGGVHVGGTARPTDPLATFPGAADRVAAAEGAEWAVRADLDAALRHYRDALAIVPAGSRAALFILTRIGRTLFKLTRYADGIAVYRQVAAAPPGAVDRHGLPFAVIALTQIVDGLSELDRPDQRASAEVELLDYVVTHPWSHDDGFGHYLNLALAAPGIAESPLAVRGRGIAGAVADLEWLRQEVQAQINADLGPRSNEGERTRHLAVHRSGESRLISYHHIQQPAQAPVVFGYEIRRSVLQQQLLDGVLAALDIGRASSVRLNERPVRDALAEVPLFPTASAWTVTLSDTQGRSIGQLVARERWTYGALVVGMLAVMIAGLVLIARASARAAELSRLKTDFVANVSHELKTPLALIRMFGETLESGIVADDDKRREFSGVIRRESERLTHLINNVLDLGRIEAGNKRYTLVQSDLVDTVRQAFEAYRPLFERLEFTAETAFPDRPVALSLDRDAIVQALINLFQNVIKYSDGPGYVGVTVRADTTWASVSVTDHGIGIPDEEIPRIFEPYYRVAGGGATSGSGLGLSIVRHAAAAHGGRVDVVSRAGHGSVFTLVLPLMAGATASAGQAAMARVEA